jgi:hypothetical protein
MSSVEAKPSVFRGNVTHVTEHGSIVQVIAKDASGKVDSTVFETRAFGNMVEERFPEDPRELLGQEVLMGDDFFAFVDDFFEDEIDERFEVRNPVA